MHAVAPAELLFMMLPKLSFLALLTRGDRDFPNAASSLNLARPLEFPFLCSVSHRTDKQAHCLRKGPSGETNLLFLLVLHFLSSSPNIPLHDTWIGNTSQWENLVNLACPQRRVTTTFSLWFSSHTDEGSREGWCGVMAGVSSLYPFYEALWVRIDLSHLKACCLPPYPYLPYCYYF